MGYEVRSRSGRVVAGDPELDDVLRDTADNIGGYITDDSGNVVYESNRGNN